MKYREFGSEFWLEKMPDDSKIYVLSGRTAINIILQDIARNEKTDIKKINVYMPAWCCESMLQPFQDSGVNIQLYDVAYKDNKLVYQLENNFHIDILYVTNYFGFSNTLDLNVVKKYKSEGSLIIYDRTHSLFMQDDDLMAQADYIFGSIRKWMGVPCGAYLEKKDVAIESHGLRDFPYIQEKIEAMRLKADYINGVGMTDKQMFMNMYAGFNNKLANDYQDYRMDDLSLHIWQYTDKEKLKNVRYVNAAVLQDYIQEMKHVNSMFSIKEGNCPLFVPVLADSKKERDELRRYLINNAIYCPIHWPKPSIVNSTMAVNDIYDQEISLICDQRYGIDDMRHIIDVINDFYQ